MINAFKLAKKKKIISVILTKKKYPNKQHLKKVSDLILGVPADETARIQELHILVGHLILKSHDILDMEIVYNHVIGKIYRGDFESIKLFLAGELEWYFLRRIFQPLTVLYAIFQTETAFWLTDIIIKLTLSLIHI